MDNLIKIQGILTSRIETREKGRETYHYGFFQVLDQEQEIPVIFKSKPEIPKGSEVELRGNWAKSNGNRPSFTATAYQILSNPPELTPKELREQIHSLLTPALKEKAQWTQTVDFLFNKLKALEKLEKMSKLGEQYLTAYLLTKSARYANYQTELLKHTDFTPEKYLKTLAWELETLEKQIKAISRKEEIYNGSLL
ncbi:MAG: hypothetical protein MRECE_35c011 [Mycoplasmataceae bacterium CE_OT135]|nr:MAG: hypothetical protein MRECE_35c011 [Mycoplasmataceae bacterium CE_OT135]